MHFAVILLGIVYVVVIALTVVRILLDTHSTPKTLAYLMLVIILPVLGVLFYHAFGINYRHLSSTNKGIREQKEMDIQLSKNIPEDSTPLLKEWKETARHYSGLVDFLK